MPLSVYQFSETPNRLYEALEQALKRLPDYAAVYDRYNHVFQLCVVQNTADCRLNFGGTFAKTDYLLKEHHAPADVARAIHDTRNRLRHRVEIDADDLRKWHLHDLCHLCRFIELIYGAPVPEALQSRFPADDDTPPRSTVTGDCIRFIVDSWDTEYLYGTTDAAGSTARVCYAHRRNVYHFDWTYLTPLLFAGAQLNLIRPRLEEGALCPELIIFEPDYLVDISTVAQCFTTYAESPLVHLINKLRPAPASEAIVLGNFAGQLLDEQINNRSGRPYKESVTDFWQEHSLSMIEADISRDFHENARQQKMNIAKALGETLPREVADFNPKDCMVEPSFFSEMLGLQGRMDFLQLDYKLLLEQKSGKGDFPYDNFIHPKEREEHYVQMLLYMMLIRYNFRNVYDHNKGELHAFLLYSKYAESLLNLGFAPDLMYRAVKVRNELAASELRYAHNDGFRLLEALTPEMLNIKRVHNALWERYQRPQLQEVLAPIAKASALERAYYLRFLTFIANEHLLSKLGNQTKENSGFAATWYDSLADKLQAGNIYDRLTLTSPNDGWEGNVQHVTLKFAETESNNMSNFRVGDVVFLYSYEPGSEPDARRNMVFRCSIADITPSTIDLALRATQSDAKVFLRHSHRWWAIEHDFIESSFSSLYRGMHSFLSAPQERRDLLLLQRAPQVDTSRTLNGDYGSFNTLATRVKQARDLFLIIGPPGTGKTSYGLLNTLKEELTEPDSSVLLLSYTNRAVDEICSKLYSEGIDFIRLGRGLNCAAEYQQNRLTDRARGCHNLAELKALIASGRVFVATTTAMDAQLSLFRLKQFSLAIIDEASQILEPHLAGILSAQVHGQPAVRKVVLIGDHKQLPAVVQQRPDVSRVDDAALNNIGLTDCRLSLFERLLKKYRTNEQVVYMLTHQGRMHPDIATFPNEAFYNGRLEVVPLPHQVRVLPASSASSNAIDRLLATRRIAFIHAAGPREPLADKVNPVEADIIAATVLRIYHLNKETFDPAETVGIIVPYRNQIAAVRNKIDAAGIPVLHDITIDTVERYQGSQRCYIIYGFTIQQFYQLNFLTNNVFEDCDGSLIDRKLNVAMTRAEEHLILVGNATLLANNATFARLIEFVRERKGYFDPPAADYVAGRFEVPV